MRSARHGVDHEAAEQRAPTRARTAQSGPRDNPQGERRADEPTHTATTAYRSSSQVVSTRPSATGIVAWKVIAPVMLPIASASLPSRIHSTLLAFSGSSVASGARTSASTSGETPADSAIVSHRADEQLGADDDRAERDQNCATIWNVLGGSSLLESK